MKPIFNRAPLSPNAAAALGVGSIRPEGWLLNQLRINMDALKNAAPTQDPCEKMRRLEARVLLAWMLDDAEEKNACTAAVSALELDTMPLLAQTAALNACRRYFTASGDKEILKRFDLFMKTLYKNIGTQPLCGDEVARGADIIELALWLYNLTGQKYLPDLAWKLRAQTLDWADAFHAFRIHSPMSRSTSLKRLEEGIADEKKEGSELRGENRPYFSTYAKQANGEDVAYGLKAPGVFDLIKSGFKEKGGFGFGWDKLTTSHGLANGMFSCDGALNGRNPVQGVDLRAICETMRSLETLITLGNYDGTQKVADVLEKIAYNTLPAAFSADMTRAQRLQQTNQVCLSREARPWYSFGEDANLLKPTETGFEAWGAFAAQLWNATDDGGLCAVSYAPCTVRQILGGVPVRMTVSGGYPFSSTVKIDVAVKQPVEFPLYLRIPFWARQPMIYLPNGEIMQVKPDETTCIRRRWTSGDVVTLELPTTPRTSSRWYQHSVAVEFGPLVMVCRPEEEDHEDGCVMTSAPWNWALYADEPMKAVCGTAERTAAFHGEDHETGVLVKAACVDWKHFINSEGYTTGNAGPIPSGEPAQGDAHILKLVPYGDTTLRITQFPIV